MATYENINSLGETVQIGNISVIPLRMTKESVQSVTGTDGEEIGTASQSLYSQYDFFANQNGAYFRKLLLNGKISYDSEYSVSSWYKLLTYHFFVPDRKIQHTSVEYLVTEGHIATDNILLENIQELSDWVFNREKEIKDTANSMCCVVSFLKNDDHCIPVISLFIESSTYGSTVLTDSARNSYNLLCKKNFTEELVNYWELRTDYRRFLTITIPKMTSAEETEEENPLSTESIKKQLDDMTPDEASDLYSIPSGARDWLMRTVNFRTHVTHFAENGMPAPINSAYSRFLNSNCYAYTQPVFKADTEYWRMNNGGKDSETWYDKNNKKSSREDSWIATNGFLPVNSAYFDTKCGMRVKKVGHYHGVPFDQDDGHYGHPIEWHVYVNLTNGIGHNIVDGTTIGDEARWAYECGIPELDFAQIDSSVQSAVCFTNLINNTQDQKVVYAYPEKEDYETTIEEGSVPVITFEVSGQNINRIDLELNNTLTRW